MSVPAFANGGMTFLSTPSARRATAKMILRYLGGIISIHALREEGDPTPNTAWPRGRAISIHALREEGDSAGAGRKCRGSDFYPRPPRGGRLLNLWVLHQAKNFYPRPPRGGRRPRSPRRCGCTLFLSTPSARRATSASSGWRRRSGYFYPRPPRGGRHTSLLVHLVYCIDFYPRPPRGGRLLLFAIDHHVYAISIHALREEGDVGLGVRTSRIIISIHALREEGDRRLRPERW